MAIGAFNTEVVHDQTKGDRTGGVAKKAWSRGLDEAERQEKSDKLCERLERESSQVGLVTP